MQSATMIAGKLILKNLVEAAFHRQLMTLDTDFHFEGKTISDQVRNVYSLALTALRRRCSVASMGRRSRSS